MEQNNYSLNLIFVVTIILGFTIAFVGSLPVFLINDIQTFQMYSSIFIIINLIISPVLVFVVFYLIGKKFDLKLNLKSSIIRLLIGAYIGHFLGYITIQFINGFWDIWSTFIASIVSSAFFFTFFIAFTALAIAYLKQNNQVPIN